MGEIGRMLKETGWAIVDWNILAQNWTRARLL
jgi:hypothetical protein